VDGVDGVDMGEKGETAKGAPQCPPLKGVARSAGGCKNPHAKVLRCRPYPPCHSERSEESSSPTGPGFYSIYSNPRVILSEAKNP
jgi:hypothetical protein